MAKKIWCVQAMVELGCGEERRCGWNKEQSEQHETSHLRRCRWEGSTRRTGWFCNCVN